MNKTLILQINVKFRAAYITFGRFDKQINLNDELKKIGVDLGPVLTIVGSFSEKVIYDDRGARISLILQ